MTDPGDAGNRSCKNIQSGYFKQKTVLALLLTAVVNIKLFFETILKHPILQQFTVFPIKMAPFSPYVVKYFLF